MIAGDWPAVGVAAAAVVGALHPGRPSWLVGALLVTLALGRRSTLVLAAAVLLLVSGLAQRSLDGLDGVRPGPFEGEVELVSDPVPSFGGVRMDVRAGGRRLEARADGAAAAALAERLAGEVLQVRGMVAPAPPESSWLVPRHVSGQLTVRLVQGWRVGTAPSRVANALRRTLVVGAEPLSERQQSLYTGLVVGDDRAQPVDLADDFLGAGLTHLLAVSGQNVAFTLAMAGPVLRRLRLWPRLALTLGVIGLFGVMTRFEPSVLRASAMAALAAVLTTTGHPTARVRVIAFAVVALLVVDPLLVQSVGFRLSVGAATAIVVLAPRIEEALPGPRALREALGVTLAAQLGVAPVLLGTFGPVPVASLPANLLAVPVAGALMVWGLTAGLLAGVVGSPIASFLHLPTRVGLDWLDAVARHFARAPLGDLGAGHLIALAVGLGLAGLGRRTRPLVRHIGLVAAATAVAMAVAVASAPAPLRSAPSPGVTVWEQGSTAVVVLGTRGGGRSVGSASVLEGLRRSGVGSIGLVVVADATVLATTVADVLVAHRIGAILVRQPGSFGELGAPVMGPPPGGWLDVGALRVQIVSVPDRLVVDARAP